MQTKGDQHRLKSFRTHLMSVVGLRVGWGLDRATVTKHLSLLCFKALHALCEVEWKPVVGRNVCCVDKLSHVKQL